MKFDPTAILITGASSGIGAALALHYADNGRSLFLGGRDRARLEQVAGLCRDKGAEVDTWVGDVRNEQAMRDWIEGSNAKMPLNLVVANAGVAVSAASVDELHEAVRSAFDINVQGMFNTVHPAIALMARRPRPVQDGRIAIISSVMGYAGTARSPAYSVSKAVGKHYGQALRGALRNLGIGVTVACPGYVDTAMMAGSLARPPFMISAPRAAKVIASAIGKNRARVTFPWQVLLIARIVINLPNFILDRLNKQYGVPKFEDN